MIFIINILNIAAIVRTTNLSNTFDQLNLYFSPISCLFRPMMSRLVLTSSTLLLLLCFWVTLSQSSPVRCCTKYSSQPFPVLRLKDFTRQDATMTCNIEAVIFTTVKDRLICANPDDLWVHKAIAHIQKKKESQHNVDTIKSA